MAKNYYKTKETVDEYIRLAKDVNGGDLIEKLKVFLPSDASLLEIGTGPGTDWNILKEDYKLVGSDNSPEFLKTVNPRYMIVSARTSNNQLFPSATTYSN